MEIVTNTVNIDECHREHATFSMVQALFAWVPGPVMSTIMERMPSPLKRAMNWAQARVIPAGDYSATTQQFNQGCHVLGKHKDIMIRTEISDFAKHLATRFRPNNQEHWPIVAVTTNSNLASAAEFRTSLETASDVAKTLIDQTDEKRGKRKIIPVGVYHSHKNFMHNAERTIARWEDLKEGKSTRQNISPASINIATLMLELASQRNANGVIEKHNGQPILRKDALQIFSHVLTYGHSGAALTNHDAIIELERILHEGNYTKAGNHNQPTKLNAVDISRMVSSIHAVSFGFPKIPGGDPLNSHRLNLVSSHDPSARLLGRITEKETLAVSTDRKLLRGHDQTAYLEAFQEQAANPHSKYNGRIKNFAEGFELRLAHEPHSDKTAETHVRKPTPGKTPPAQQR